MFTKLSDFELIDPEDADVLSVANETAKWVDLSRSLVDLVNVQVARAPDAAACLSAEGCMTYRDLDARANKLAHHLIARGVGPDVPVGVLFERSPENLVAILGTLKAGGCYVPLDPQYPPDYIQQVLEDAQPKLVVLSRRLHERLGVGADRLVHLDDELVVAEDDHSPRLKVSPEQLACVMYTSGASGVPRGVMVPHRQILNWLHALWERVPFAAGEVVAQKTSTSSAISVKELFAGLLAGVPQVFFDDATVRDVPRFVRELERWSVTQLYTLPSQVEAILSSTEGAYERLRSLRHLFISIEPCTTELMAKVVSAIPWVTPWYIYGCSEISDMTYCDPREQGTGTGFVPIGRPIHNTRVFVLDEDLRRVPVGAMGEMYVESLSLARGYQHLPELTAERFIANPHGKRGSRLFKTGDLARYLPDGALEFLGRREDQVKIRGYRVDVRQVERALAQHRDIREVAVVGRQHRATIQLVAYLVPRSNVADPIPQIKEYLSGCMPAYMVPSIFQFLEALPRLPNGRVDMSRLPEPSVAEDRRAAYLPPRTETERVLAGIWIEVLSQGGGIAPVTVGATHNFFDLGGHSLLAAQMFSRIRRRFEIELPISTLFQSPVLENFARAVDTAIVSAGSQADGLVRVTDRGQAVPLSYVQQRLWFVNEHMPEQRTSYNIAFACHVRGSGLSIAALRSAVNALVARHETLRTTFVVPEGEVDPVQRIADSLWVQVPMYDIEECEIPTRVAAHARHVSDLAKGPLLKVSVLRVTPDYYVFMMNIHHIICDGWSVGILLRDLREFYAAAETGALPRLPALPVQYADYAVWQRQRDLHAHLTYWTSQLDGYEEGLSLPYDFARPAGRNWRADVIRHKYPANLAARLSALSGEHRVTLFVTLMTSVAILLNRYTGRNDLCLGTTVAGRDHLDLENLIGCFVNIIAIRLDLSDNPTAETLLQRTKAQVLAAIEHSGLPFEHVLAALKKHRDSSQIPLVPVMVRHQNFLAAEAQDPGDPGAGEIHFGEIEFGERTTPNELDLQFIGDGSSLEVAIEYAGGLFSERTIRRLIEHHEQVLQTLVDRPDENLTAFRLMPESGQLIEGPVAASTTTLAPHMSKSVIELFDDQVKSSPDAIACMGQVGSLTYRELDLRANRLAHYLMVRGVDRETRVGLWFQRSPDLLVAVLGILKAGGCYVALDPDYPQNYVNDTLADTQPFLVLSTVALGTRLPQNVGHVVYLDEALAACEEASNPCVAIHPEQLACIVNTAGSTGQPKGVMVPHRQILNGLHPLWAMVPFGQHETVAQTTSIAFSISIKELFAGLLAGVTQVFINQDVVKDVAAFVAQLESWRVTRLHALPDQLEAVLSHVAETTTGRLPTLRHVFLTGAPCSLDVVGKLHTTLPCCTAWFTYDCTETSTITCCQPHEQFSSTGFVPAGRPIVNTRVLVLDDQLRLRPVGIMGEIYVESIGTARGYWRQPVATAEHFIPNPFGEPGSRLYRTGDLGRYLEDGLLEILWPRECEVKIRGHRVDVRQVEKVLERHPDVLKSAVMGWPRGASNPQLLAYVTAKPNRVLVTDALRPYLSTNLPTYMVPTNYQLLPALPRLPNGKLDRLGLPEPTRAVTDPAYRAPRSETERAVSDLWADVLKQGGMPAPKAGTSDNFFDLGGHSLLAIHLLAKMRRHFGVTMSVRTLYEFPVLNEFAKAVDRALLHEDACAAAPAEASVLVPLSAGGRLTNLFCVHPVGGQIHFYRELARKVDQAASVYALQSDGAREFDTLEGLARFYCNEIRATQPQGTYRILGWCSGGLIALAIKRELERSGCVVEYLGLVDVTPIPRLAGEGGWAPLIAVKAILGAMRGRSFSIVEVNDAWSFLGSRGWTWGTFATEDGRAAIEELARHFGITGAEVSSEYLLSVLKTTNYYISLLAGFLPDSLGSNTYIYQAAEQDEETATKDERVRWASLLDRAPRPKEIVQVPGNHYTILQRDNVTHLGNRITETLDALNRLAVKKTDVA